MRKPVDVAFGVLAFIAAVLLVFVSISPAQTASARKSQEDEIREAVFRYQFDHNASATKNNAAAYCLAIGKKDSSPSDAFIRRFRGHNPPVRKVSECRYNKSTGEREVGGKTALTFQVSTITWRSDSEVEVKGGYSEGYELIGQHVQSGQKGRQMDGAFRRDELDFMTRNVFVGDPAESLRSASNSH
jgi:hypothetical protein